MAAINEESVAPKYDYSEVAATIAAIDEKIAIIKHALNVANAITKVQVGDAEMSIDTILMQMALDKYNQTVQMPCRKPAGNCVRRFGFKHRLREVFEFPPAFLLVKITIKQTHSSKKCAYRTEKNICTILVKLRKARSSNRRKGQYGKKHFNY